MQRFFVFFRISRIDAISRHRREDLAPLAPQIWGEPEKRYSNLERNRHQSPPELGDLGGNEIALDLAPLAPQIWGEPEERYSNLERSRHKSPPELGDLGGNAMPSNPPNVKLLLTAC
jgi:hypothetical protein